MVMRFILMEFPLSSLFPCFFFLHRICILRYSGRVLGQLFQASLLDASQKQQFVSCSTYAQYTGIQYILEAQSRVAYQNQELHHRAIFYLFKIKLVELSFLINHLLLHITHCSPQYIIMASTPHSKYNNNCSIVSFTILLGSVRASAISWNLFKFSKRQTTLNLIKMKVNCVHCI